MYTGVERAERRERAFSTESAATPVHSILQSTCPEASSYNVHSLSNNKQMVYYALSTQAIADTEDKAFIRGNPKHSGHRLRQLECGDVSMEALMLGRLHIDRCESHIPSRP
jgi:hypothetical protein